MNNVKHYNVAPFLDGRYVESLASGMVSVVAPSSGKPLLDIPVGCEADVNRAVVSSRIAFNDGRWHETPPSARKKILHRLADLIEDNSAELDFLDAGEMGKPISEAFANALGAAGLMRFYAEAVDKVTGDVFGSDRSSFVAQRRVPRGVVAAIVPWNFPTFVAVLKFAPALAAGNCVVLKPSEMSSRSALRMAQLAMEAGLPPGVLNVVPGVGETVGRALGLHNDVDMISFTGSTEVGKLMMQYSGQSNMKVVMTECGGKSPQIVFDDGVDLDAASDSIARLMLTNQGQVCSAGSRLLVARSIESTLLEKVTARFRELVIGDPLNSQTTFGPLVSSKQCERVLGYIEAAQRDGASLITGGKRTLPQSGGFFIEPTIFSDVSPRAKLAQEEIFGPVLAVMSFETEAQAIHLANDSQYALAAYAWTADLSRGMRLAKNIRSTVWINAAAPGEGPGHAFCAEPTGQSGIGAEGGLGGMESYLRRQLVWISHS